MGRHCVRFIIVGALFGSMTPEVVGASRSAQECFGSPATIVAIAEDEKTRGTAGPDVIVGSSGKDRIAGFGGRDRICSGGGADSIDGNVGDDRIDGGKGRDYLNSGPGDNILEGGAGPDVITSFGGDDRIDGGGGFPDLVSYEKNNDGRVTVDLQEGTMTGWGTDTLRRVEGAATGYGRDSVIGDEGPNVLYVNSYGNRKEEVNAGKGRDLVHVMSGTFNFIARGGGGRDLIGFSWGESIEVDLRVGLAGTVGRLEKAGGRLFGFEDVDGSHGEDLIKGDSGTNHLRGLGGNDRIIGRGGDDHLNGFGFGKPDYGRSDILNGGPGADFCRNGTRFRGCERAKNQQT